MSADVPWHRHDIMSRSDLVSRGFSSGYSRCDRAREKANRPFGQLEQPIPDAGSAMSAMTRYQGRRAVAQIASFQ
jgi:hypothetical protein